MLAQVCLIVVAVYLFIGTLVVLRHEARLRNIITMAALERMMNLVMVTHDPEDGGPSPRPLTFLYDNRRRIVWLMRICGCLIWLPAWLVDSRWFWDYTAWADVERSMGRFRALRRIAAEDDVEPMADVGEHVMHAIKVGHEALWAMRRSKTPPVTFGDPMVFYRSVMLSVAARNTNDPRKVHADYKTEIGSSVTLGEYDEQALRSPVVCDWDDLQPDHKLAFIIATRIALVLQQTQLDHQPQPTPVDVDDDRPTNRMA